MNSKIENLQYQAQTLVLNKAFKEAAQIYEQLCVLNSNDTASWMALGDIYMIQQRRQAAFHCFQKLYELDSNSDVACHKLASSLHSMGRFDDAVKFFNMALKLNPESAGTYFQLANLYKDTSQFDLAEEMYRKTLQLNNSQAKAHCYLGKMLQRKCLLDDAMVCYDKALALDPDFSEAIWSKLRMLPIICDDTKQLEKYRHRYKEGLRQLEETLLLDTSEQRSAALWGIASSSSFLLQYQGRNDLALQKDFGRLVHKIVTASFPQWAKPIEMPQLVDGEKIRIGYASSYLCAHNGAIWLLGWLRHCDRSRFEIFCYHTGNVIDDKTNEFKSLSDHFYHLPNNLKNPCEQIVSDKLHILVYPELGMYAPTQLMAGLYLAPVQCTSWGHPITSGFPTLDYWISSDLMEPANGQDHYCENLIRLPNIAISYTLDNSEKIHSQPLKKIRADFRLSDNAVLYFCGQSLFKYLPEYDYLYPAIAKKVPNAQFVFLSVLNSEVGEKFKKRLDRAFSEEGLNADDYYVVLPRLSQDDFEIMNQLSDVFLDNPPWSGANTTLTAIDCNLPVVTLPTEFMRGRHSYAILKMMKLTGTIASNPQQYVDIAVRLGVDKNWRDEIIHKIKNTKHLLYNDVDCVKGLEAFYQQVVNDG